jgi:hypothetical protein
MDLGAGGGAGDKALTFARCWVSARERHDMSVGMERDGSASIWRKVDSWEGGRGAMEKGRGEEGKS